jgi:hypothetical protein
MNSRRVIIKNAFGSLKNRWCILRHFNSKVDRATRVVVAYNVLHIYCLEWGAPKPCPRNVVAPPNNFQRFGDKLPIVRERKIAKIEGENLELFCLNNS